MVECFIQLKPMQFVPGCTLAQVHLALVIGLAFSGNNSYLKRGSGGQGREGKEGKKEKGRTLLRM